MSEEITEPIPDAYAEHVDRMRRKRAQEAEDVRFDLRGLSEDAVEFIDILCERSVAQTPRMIAAKTEVERAVRRAVQDSIVASQRNEKMKTFSPERSEYVDSG